MESYSKKTKEFLLEAELKKKCCKRIFDDILSLKDVSSYIERADKISAVADHFRCGSCFGHAAAALFIIFGTVTDPAKQYHLELSFETVEERAAADYLLSSGGIVMSQSQRKGRYILYIKDSGKIEDFFAIIGANKAAFDLMNSKIIREIRGNANRQSNCDMANISKSVSAAEYYAEIISEMEKSGALLRMPSELRETAEIRLKNTQASMTELGLLHQPQISKSGVKHRLDKIIEYYNSKKNEK